MRMKNDLQVVSCGDENWETSNGTILLSVAQPVTLADTLNDKFYKSMTLSVLL